MSEEKLYLPYTVIVEGKYDKIKLSSILDAVIIQTDGFAVFKDKEKQALIRKAALTNGIIIATDSDSAGFKLRSFIRSIAKDAVIINLYIPQLEGKEKRKITPSKEGFLGVEGIAAEKLRNLFKEYSRPVKENEKKITKADFFQDGLSGGANSSQRRQKLLKQLDLPVYLSANSLIEVINSFLGYEEYKKIIMSLNGAEED